MDQPGITIEGPAAPELASQVCRDVLRALPDWFGIEAANAQYIQSARQLPTWVAFKDGLPVGFLTVKQHFADSAEITVMGVLPSARRCGVGRALVGAVEAVLREQGVKYLQVKTLSPSDPDPNYAQTRAFYLSIGFCPLEEFKSLWGEENPCLLMVKKL